MTWGSPTSWGSEGHRRPLAGDHPHLPFQDSLPTPRASFSVCSRPGGSAPLRGLEPSPSGKKAWTHGPPPRDKSGKNGAPVSLTSAADKYQYLEKGTICVQMKHGSKIHQFPNEVLSQSSLFLRTQAPPPDPDLLQSLSCL